MSQYSPYMLNVAATGDNNQYNVQSFEVNNMLKNLFENNANALAQNMGGQDNVYFQPNKMPNQYYIQIPQNYTQMPQQQYMPMMSLPNGNMFYINQQPGFPTPDAAAQYNGQLLSMQVPGAVMPPVNNNNNMKTNESVSSANSRSRKKTYRTPRPSEVGSNGENTDDIPRDTKNRPLSFSCSECTKRFSTQTRLDQHFLCHTNERPYVCPECLFAFTQKSYLMRHAAVHREERQFECEQCKKTYKHYGSLANHRKTHKNGKSSTRTSMSVKTEKTINQSVIHPPEEAHSNSNSSFVPAGGAEYASYQPEQHQQYGASQYAGDMSSIYANSSFQSQLASSDVNTNFLDQLNFHNEANFFQLTNTDMPHDATVPAQSDLNNNSIMSLDNSASQQQISLNLCVPAATSSTTDASECISTYSLINQ